MNAHRLLPTLLCLASFATAEASDSQEAAPERVALGAELDLLPIALSAAAGQVGGSGNVWVGLDRIRLRAVGSYIAFPLGFLTPSGFASRELTVAAGIVDYFFLPRFQGPWIGAGLEYWWNEVGSSASPETASWSSGVFTVGTGFVWPIWGNLYLNPWAAGHLLLSRPEVTLHGATWTPAPLTAEVSLKIGWSF
jgi:hypothetical protein